jgi:hypothetical protein
MAVAIFLVDRALRRAMRVIAASPPFFTSRAERTIHLAHFVISGDMITAARWD